MPDLGVGYVPSCLVWEDFETPWVSMGLAGGVAGQPKELAGALRGLLGPASVLAAPTRRLGCYPNPNFASMKS